MKIGIVTIHSAYNYGSALQAVATCEAVNRIADISAEIIDYQPVLLFKKNEKTFQKE